MFRRLDLLTAILIAACVVTTLSVDIPAAAVSQAAWWKGEYWRIIPSTFLHGNWTHLIVNCLSLYFVGTVIAEGLGRPVYLAAVVLGAFAGFGASLLFAGGSVAPDPVYRVGISGAIAGLVGLILAVEWRNSRSILEFLRQRNTILIIVFVGISVGLGLEVERRNPGVQIDHTAHIGGALACLVAGLCYYGRRRLHGARGLAAAVLLGIGPLALAAYPMWNVDFCMFKARRAERAGEDAGAWWDRAYRLDPTNPRAAAGAAVYRDDPALLDKARETMLPEETYALVQAYLLLAENRLEKDPAAAMALIRTASEIRPAPYQAWARLAGVAGGAHPQIGRFAMKIALGLVEAEAVENQNPDRVAQLRETAQRYATGLLAGLEPELVAALRGEADDRLGLALEAAHAIEVLAPRIDDEGVDEQTRAGLEQWLVRDLEIVGTLEGQGADDADAGRLQSLRRSLRRAWKKLADAADETPRGADYLFREALWWEKAVAGTPQESAERGAIAAKMERALREARSYGAPATERLATQWFRAHNLPVPTGDLAELPDGG